ncbi:OHCU decarboxylase [Pseudolabrys sp. Root1462]|uniref:2-oxo-4-hydroxy-4-carboxy-5-ureidoimidazoline decarboxylase n=1 Tax=Pseudolabrys sp. Root1462 TaxID=1736466 RepID=UPI000702470A|nr:2-oxo-4-hydroxy-4-carboxy-5-ureidoimidazoline decarboxylase [Pseudolabrys sp. Root1462]KQY97355.1 OHCU decarboxylase [Pseudolabrys sp. Root1462]
MTPITLDQLNALSATDFTAALADIYEHSPWVAEAAAKQRPFATLNALHEAMVAAVKAAPDDARMKLIAAHPDLAGKAARAGSLTRDSTDEQMSAGLDRLSEADYARFHKLNDAYKAKFGIPFIVCVRRHTKDSILDEFERRLAQVDAAETDTALGEIFRIGALRLDQRITAADKVPITGRLSTHVLDTHSGRPAQGVAVELWELSRDGSERLIVRATTNRDGRTDAPLIGGRPVPRGTYELRFAIGGYFRNCGVPLPDPPFLDIVPIRFGVAEPEGHYHVPLSASPWAYGTYRGS